VEEFIFGDDSPEREEARANLAKEYKIHLMPQPEYTFAVTRRICEHLRDDSTLNDAVAGFKVKLNPDTIQHGDQVLPVVVIYSMLGRDNAQVVLDRIYHAFPEHRRIGRNVTPRDNRRINNLIYWAQSGGDLKHKYRGFKKRNTQFSDTGSHFRGEENRLRHPGTKAEWLVQTIVGRMSSVFAQTSPE